MKMAVKESVIGGTIETNATELIVVVASTRCVAMQPAIGVMNQVDVCARHSTSGNRKA